VTGCLREAPATPTGTSGSAAAAPSATDAAGKADAANNPAAKFVLADATSSSANAAPAADAHGSAPKTYQLIANESALSPHVGKKLELTGTIEGQEASASATAQAGASASASASMQPKLRVESGKVIAADCK